MKRNAASFLCFAAGLVGLLLAGWALTVRAALPAAEGIPTDWTHRHVIFSQPAAPWQVDRISPDPRYWQQFYRQSVRRELIAQPDASSLPSTAQVRRFAANVQSDWSQDLGTGASAGAGNYPAKYNFGITTANCGSAASPDFVVFSTGLLGSASQASIVAFDNLYSGCATGTVPTVYWGYNTGGQILTSPVISGDGKQVAFAETAGGFGILVVLKWAAGTGTVGSPANPTNVAASAYPTCIAPCMTQLILRDGVGAATNDTTSSVFVDYTNDVGWVGGAPGWLHKISHVFRGVPAEVRGGGFPVNVRGTTAISSPVYDQVSQTVFVGDSGGIMNRINASTGARVSSGQLDFALGLVTAPVVDSTAGKVWVFSSSDGSGACGGANCSAVFELATNFGAGTTGTKATVGTSSATPKPLYEAGFDSTYLSSGNATGNLYLCGNTGGIPTLYRVPVAAGAFGAVVKGPALGSAAGACSPVSDVPNPNATGGASEWIFAGAAGSGAGNNCAAGGCVMNFRVQPWKASTVYAVGQQVLDTHFQIQTVRLAGTSRATTPPWSVVVGASTADNTVRWLNQGPQVAAHASWLPSNAYAVGTEIIDTANNIQLVITAGTSRTAVQGHPGWSPAVNGVTADNTVRWRNVGAISTASQAASAGTSGIIIDNTVGSGTLAGASQVYYSTLGNQSCGTSGTGGCAVQASQPALQ